MPISGGGGSAHQQQFRLELQMIYPLYCLAQANLQTCTNLYRRHLFQASRKMYGSPLNQSSQTM
jgi:hypothetical protein